MNYRLSLCVGLRTSRCTVSSLHLLSPFHQYLRFLKGKITRLGIQRCREFFWLSWQGQRRIYTGVKPSHLVSAHLVEYNITMYNLHRMNRLLLVLALLGAVFSYNSFSGWAGYGPCPNGCFRGFWADTQLLDLNAAGCAAAQTLTRTVTFTQTLDTSNYYVALAYNQVLQTCPQTSTGQVVSFNVTVASKTTTSLVLSFSLSPNMCISTLGVNVAMINHPLMVAGISYVDTSSTILYTTGSGTVNVPLSISVPATTGPTVARAWLVGWNGNWTSGGPATDPGIELYNFTASGTFFSLTIRGYNQQLSGVTLSYLINMQSSSMLTYEQVVDNILLASGTINSGTMTFTLPTGATTPNFIGMAITGLSGFQYTKANPWSWSSTTNLTGTTNITLNYTQVNNQTPKAFKLIKFQQAVYMRVYCLNPLQSINAARTACVASSTCGTGSSRDACGFCITCNSRCETCLGLGISECLTCNASQFRILNGTSGSCGTNCVCQAYYFQNGTDICAINCAPLCLTCAILETNCTSCTSTRTLVSNACLCSTGYFDIGSLICSACDPLCLNCSIASTNCTACVASRILTGNSCPCRTGYYESGGVTCSPCLYSCLTCVGSASPCTSCDITRTLISGACPCNTGFYDSGSTVCSACSYTCLNCTSSATSCTACVATRTLTSSACPCNTGYYDSGSSTCSPCAYSCLNCTGTSTTCTACDPSRVLINGSCLCPVGNYDIGVPVCALCDVKCLNCSGTALTCTACVFTRTVVGNSCPCSSGYYESGLSTCSACDYTCLNCSITSLTCTACPATRTFVGNSCPCSTGYYESGFATCSACSYSCVGCSVLPTNCTSCSLTRTLVAGVCVCNVGLYDTGVSTCASCIYSCLNCSGTASNCTACDPTRTLVSGSCVCNSALYDNGVSAVCSSCNYTCLSCLGTATNCTSCDPTRTLQTGSCICNSGLYDAGVPVCSACSYTCLTCFGTSTNCTSCINTRVFAANSCPCDVGTIEVGAAMCSGALCTSNCLTCTSVASTCTSCDPTRVLVSGSCICNTGYFENGNFACSPCVSSCLNCSGTPSNCIACAPFRILTNGRCLCQTGKYDSGTACLACNPSCTTCTNGTSCATCPASYTIVNGLCACLATQYVDPGTLLCASCPATCLSCTDSLTCTSCSNLYQLSGGQCVSPTCSPPCNTNYSCYTPASGSPTCSFNQSIIINLVKTTKNLTANVVTFLMQLDPPLTSLDGRDFTTILNSSIANSTMTPTYLGNGMLSIDVNYQTPLQNQTVEFTLNPQNLGAEFALSPRASISFMVNPNNNLEADVHDPAVYSQVQTLSGLAAAVMYIGLIGMLFGVFLGKFIGVEMSGVVQLAFIGLLTMPNLHPLFSPMTAMGYITGPDQRTMSGPTNVPNQIYAIQYSSQLASSLNYSMILLLLPLIVGAILFTLSKCITSKSQQLRNWAMISLCEYQLTATMFLAYHIMAGTVVMAMYMSPSSLFAISIIEASVFFLIAGGMATLFKMRPDHFGQYKSAFNTDVYSQHHYIGMLISRVLVAIILVAVSGVDSVAFIAAIFPVALIVLVAAKKPYIHAYNNIRAIINEVVVIICLAIYGYYRCAVTKADRFTSLNSMLPYLVLILLLLSELMNLATMGKYFYDTYQASKEQSVKKQTDVKEKIDQDNMLIEKNLKELMRGMRVNPSSSATSYRSTGVLPPNIFKSAFDPENVSLGKQGETDRQGDTDRQIVTDNLEASVNSDKPSTSLKSPLMDKSRSIMDYEPIEEEVMEAESSPKALPVRSSPKAMRISPKAIPTEISPKAIPTENSPKAIPTESSPESSPKANVPGNSPKTLPTKVEPVISSAEDPAIVQANNEPIEPAESNEPVEQTDQLKQTENEPASDQTLVKPSLDQAESKAPQDSTENEPDAI